MATVREQRESQSGPVDQMRRSKEVRLIENQTEMKM